MRSSKSKLKASVYWRTSGQFWKLNQVQLFRDQNERQPIRSFLFNVKACDRTAVRATEFAEVETGLKRKGRKFAKSSNQNSI